MGVIMSIQEIHEISISDIVISKNNVRLHDPERDLDELAASIKKHGLLQPVVLLGEYGKKPYELISGQRRLLAHQKILKAKTIKAVFSGDLSSTQSVIRSLVENMQRLDLEYEDTARAITKLYEDFGKDERKVHQETGLSLRKIRDYILIEAQATPKIRKLLRERKVSPADVKRALHASQSNISKAEELLDLMVKRTPTTHEKRRIVQYGEKYNDMSASTIVEKAMKPHIEDNIIISLPEEIKKALELATRKLSMEPEELASKALSEWLRSKGFLK